MRLYAVVTNDRGGRPARKGGDKHLTIELTEGNRPKYTLVFKGDTLLCTDPEFRVLLEDREKA